MLPVPATSEVRVKDPAMLFVLRQFFTTPTAIMAGLRPARRSAHVSDPGQPGESNLGRLSALDEIAHLVVAGKVSPSDRVLLLVPGSIGYRSLTLVLNQNVETGLKTRITAALTAFGLAGGLIVANVLVPPAK